MQAVVLAIIVSELAAWKLCHVLDLHFNPLLIGFLATGAIAAIAAWRYEGADIE